MTSKTAPKDPKAPAEKEKSLLVVKLSRAQRKQISQAAERKGLAPSAFVRMAALDASSKKEEEG